MSLLTACSDDDIDRVYTVGEADNAIVLRAGVNEGGAGVETRSRDDNHAKHLAFTSSTKVALRIDGTWTGHSPATISQQTIATVGTATNLHNTLSAFDPVRYWDDYGTADPANAGTGKGREKGLTIYGIGVDGVTDAPTINTTAGSSWTDFSWKVCSSSEPTTTSETKLIDQTGGWANYDLLTSNNIHEVAEGKDYDGTYKFDDYLHDKPLTTESDKNSSNILEFTHAMTKITVLLTAGEGFPRTVVDDETTAQFVDAPTVTLEGFNYTGSVSVETKTSTPTTSATANIKMHLNGAGNVHTATFDALVFPGNKFENNTQILTFTADGNTLHVTAEKLNAAIDAAIANTSINYPATSGNHTLLQAWNYLLKITVKKTDLDIEATILDWNEVVAEEEAPKINFSQCYGQEGNDFANGFTFYRSTSVDGSYISGLTEGNTSTVSYTSSKYTMSPQLYWPDHQTHYFFRGVWPLVDSNDSSVEPQQLGPTSSQIKNNYIEVANVAYKQGYYPSDLMIGMPRKADGTIDETCKAGHKTGDEATSGICATDAAEGGTHADNNEGLIHLNFQYVMSKVQFSLRSTGTVPLGNIVYLNNVKVEIIDGYTQGKIRLSDGLHEEYVNSDKSNYTLNVTQTPGTYESQYYTVTTLDAIVPQELSDDVLVRISILDSDDNVLDVYEAQLNKIKVKTNNNTGALITEWKPGNYYKYYLDINKTAINVTATLTDWVTVEASDEVWF